MDLKKHLVNLLAPSSSAMDVDHEVFLLLNDFNLLLFLKRVFDEKPWKEMVQAVATAQKEGTTGFHSRLSSLDAFRTLLTILDTVSADTQDSGSKSSALWSCSFCTFVNGGSRGDCEMCSLPRDQ